MADLYVRDPKRVEKMLRDKGVVVVMGRDHAKTPQDVINTVLAIYEAGYIAEVTFRIPEGILKEAMGELRKRREESVKSRPGDPLLLGVGSVINPRELQTAIEMGFDMIVGPDTGMGGCREPIEFVRIVRAAKCFGVPGTFSPSEFAYFLEREDGLEPDGIKIFNASVYGPSGVGALLAPYQRDRHNGKLIMPTGGVNLKTAAGFQEQISKRGYCPVLGMSAPLELVTERKKIGDPDTIRESLAKFKAEFQPYKPS
jgi:2-keto-3-deoxy-6-phosphogluconate aldolase